MSEYDFDHDYNQGGANASKTFPMQCSALRKNGFVMMGGRPCKIVEMSTSKTGKHGHAKVNLTGIDIFTSKKITDVAPSTHNMDVPVVNRAEYTVMLIDETKTLELLCTDGTTKSDVRLPEGELGANIEKAFEAGKEIIVTVISAVDEEAVISYKESQEQ